MKKWIPLFLLFSGCSLEPEVAPKETTKSVEIGDSPRLILTEGPIEFGGNVRFYILKDTKTGQEWVWLHREPHDSLTPIPR